MRLSDSPLFDEIYRSAHSVWSAAEDFTHGVGLAGDASVPAGAEIGVTVGRLMASSSEMVLSLLSGPFTITSDGDLKLDGPTGAQGSTLTARIKAERATPYLSITQDLSVEVVAPAITLGTLTLSTMTYAANVMPGATVADINGKTAGSVLTISPNDGLLMLNAEQDALVRGTASATAGVTEYAITETIPGASRTHVFSIIVTQAPPTVLSEAAFSTPENEPARHLLFADVPATWAFISGAGDADNGLASIDDQELVLPGVDYESPHGPTYSFRVQATSVASGLQSDAQVITATILNSQITPSTADQVAALKTAGDNLGSGNLNTSGTQLILPIRVAAAANQVLVVTLQTQSGTEPAVRAVDGVRLERKVNSTVTPIADLVHVSTEVHNAGTRFVQTEIYMLANPPTGSFQATAHWTSQNRLQGQVIVLNNVNTQVPPVVLTPLKSVSTTGDYNHTFATPAPDMLIVGAIGHEQTASAGATIVPKGPMILTNVVNAIGTSRIGAQFIIDAPAAGDQVTGYQGHTNGALDAARYALMTAIAFRSVPFQEVSPTYFVDAELGSDSNPGTQEAPFATLSAVNMMSPVPAGFELYLRGDQAHRPATYQDGQTILDLAVQSGATANNRPKIRSYGGGRALIAGDWLYESGWSEPTSAETNTWAAANAQKRVMGPGFVWTNFPIIDDKMHYPCTWSPTGEPSSIDTFFESFPNNNAFYFPPSSDLQSGDVKDPTKKIRWEQRQTGVNSSGEPVYAYDIEIEHPALITRYGATGPVGAYVMYREDGNWTKTSEVTGFVANGAASYLTFTHDTRPHPLFFWNIQAHPRDLLKVGTYAWSADGETMYVAWRSGARKSVSRHVNGSRIEGNFWDVQGVDFGRCSGVSGNTSATNVLAFGGSDHIWNDVGFRQCVNTVMPNVMNCGDAAGPGVRATLTNLRMVDCPTHSGFRFQQLSNSLVDGFIMRRMGRTLIYFGGASNGNVVQNGDCCDHMAVHGNCDTNYQSAHNNTLCNLGVMGSGLPITSQIDQDAALIPNPKSIHRSNYVVTGGRPISTIKGVAYTNTPLARIDGGETGSTFDRIMMALASNTGIGFGVQTKGALQYKNEGAKVKRSICHSIGFATGGGVFGGTEVTLENTIAMNSVYGGTGLGGAQPWTSSGATVVNTTIEPGVEWNGYFTSRMQQVYTLNDTADGYEAARVGPAQWAWMLPAYGSTFALTDVGLTTSVAFDGHQGGKPIGSLYGMMPDSVPSLPPGVLDNDLFELDRGVLYPKANLSSGAYSIRVDQECADPLAQSATKSTTLPITVVAP